MNHWHIENMAEIHRKDLLFDGERHRLENSATNSRQNQPGLFTRTMHSLAVWMISAGRELHNHYELPTAHSHQNHSGSFIG
jgi:hypothetical protein